MRTANNHRSEKKELTLLSRKRAVSHDYVQHRPARHMNVARLLYEGFGFQLRS